MLNSSWNRLGMTLFGCLSCASRRASQTMPPFTLWRSTHRVTEPKELLSIELGKTHLNEMLFRSFLDIRIPLYRQLLRLSSRRCHRSQFPLPPPLLRLSPFILFFINFFLPLARQKIDFCVYFRSRLQLCSCRLIFGSRCRGEIRDK